MQHTPLIILLLARIKLSKLIWQASETREEHLCAFLSRNIISFVLPLSRLIIKNSKWFWLERFSHKLRHFHLSHCHCFPLSAAISQYCTSNASSAHRYEKKIFLFWWITLSLCFLCTWLADVFQLLHSTMNTISLDFLLMNSLLYIYISSSKAHKTFVILISFLLFGTVCGRAENFHRESHRKKSVLD